MQIEGILSQINASCLAEVKTMKSVLGIELFLKPGSKVVRTMDCFTFGGIVKLFHPCADIMEADFHRLRELEMIMFDCN